MVTAIYSHQVPSSSKTVDKVVANTQLQDRLLSSAERATERMERNTSCLKQMKGNTSCAHCDSILQHLYESEHPNRTGCLISVLVLLQPVNLRPVIFHGLQAERIHTHKWRKNDKNDIQPRKLKNTKVECREESWRTKSSKSFFL